MMNMDDDRNVCDDGLPKSIRVHVFTSIWSLTTNGLGSRMIDLTVWETSRLTEAMQLTMKACPWFWKWMDNQMQPMMPYLSPSSVARDISMSKVFWRTAIMRNTLMCWKLSY